MAVRTKEDEAHSSRHVALQGRGKCLEARFIEGAVARNVAYTSGDATSAVGFGTSVSELEHQPLQGRMDSRERIIGILGDSVDRHVQCVHQERELHGEENALLRERLTSAEGLQCGHFTALQTRTQCVEKLLGDVIDYNARSERAHAMRATVQNERMVSLETLLDNSVKKRARCEQHERSPEPLMNQPPAKVTRAEQIRREKEHEASLKQQGAEVEERLDCIAELLGDSAQKHARWGQTSAEQTKLL